MSGSRIRKMVEQGKTESEFRQAEDQKEQETRRVLTNVIDSIGLDVNGEKNKFQSLMIRNVETVLLAIETVSDEITLIKNLSLSPVTINQRLTSVIVSCGISEEGSYQPNTFTNYINSAVNLMDADRLLDQKLHEVDSKVELDIRTKILSNMSDIESRLSSLYTNLGISTTGNYDAEIESNYLSIATSLKDADRRLDSKLKNISDRLETLEERVNNL